MTEKIDIVNLAQQFHTVGLYGQEYDNCIEAIVALNTEELDWFLECYGSIIKGPPDVMPRILGELRHKARTGVSND